MWNMNVSDLLSNMFKSKKEITLDLARHEAEKTDAVLAKCAISNMLQNNTVTDLNRVLKLNVKHLDDPSFIFNNQGYILEQDKKGTVQIVEANF